MIRRVSVLLGFALLSLGSLTAQIPTQARPLNAPKPNAPPILVANPYVTSVADSATAVAIGTAFRERMAKSVVGRDWNVITREKMNEALASFGYPADAILAPEGARVFAQKVGSTRFMVMPTLTHLPTGQLHLTARLVGTFNANDMAGYIAKGDQEPGQKLKDFAEGVADQLRPALKALDQNSACYDAMFTDTEKATEAAQKALKTVPGFAPAQYCLGEMALLKDSTSAAAEQFFQQALTTDPQSLKSLSELGVIYQKRADSAKVITTYQQMLRIEPLNQKLRETAFDLFRKYGSQDAAEQVADQGILTDPTNTDWYDLKSNACLAQSKFKCAIDELEKLFAVDSTRADTAFYRKINAAAHFGEDTVRYAKWAAKGIQKYPDDLLLLQDAALAAAQSGDADAALAATRKLLVISPEDLEPLRTTAVTLANTGQIDRILEFIPLVHDSGDPDLQNTFGNLLVNAASKTAGENPARADTLSQRALDVGTTDPALLSYANYFIGRNLFTQVATMSKSVRESKKCDEAKAYLAVLTRAKTALEGAALSTNEQIKAFTVQTLTPVNSEIGVVPDMITAFCK